MSTAQGTHLVFDQSGIPTEVARVESFAVTEPKGHEVLVRMAYAPINPADLNVLEGTYGKLPALPAVPGIEGSGVVLAVGDAVTSLEVGDSVLLLHSMGSWTSHLLRAENQFARLPKGFDLVQGAMLRVNPVTAWLLLHEYRELQEGAFVLQNAANSGVGRAVIQVARELGYRTVNFVRRPELIAELKALGADAVFLDNDEGLAAAREFIGDKEVPLALNAVGGDSALRLMELLSVSGAHVTYGAMSRRSLKLPNRYLIFKDIEIRGCWVSRWMEKASHTDIHEMMLPLVQMIEAGKLVLPVEKVLPLASYTEALALAQQSGRNGKVLFSL